MGDIRRGIREGEEGRYGVSVVLQLLCVLCPPNPRKMVDVVNLAKHKRRLARRRRTLKPANILDVTM